MTSLMGLLAQHLSLASPGCGARGPSVHLGCCCCVTCLRVRAGEQPGYCHSTARNRHGKGHGGGCVVHTVGGQAQSAEHRTASIGPPPPPSAWHSQWPSRLGLLYAVLLTLNTYCEQLP
jgi:hypothetical protein